MYPTYVGSVVREQKISSLLGACKVILKFFRQNFSKIAENGDHNIDPLDRTHVD
jgi:hypothetical protein